MKQNKVTLVFGEKTLDTFAEDVNSFYEFMTEIEDFVGTKKDLRDALKTKFASIGAFSAAKIGRAHVLNSSHRCISYAVFCLKKKKIKQMVVFYRIERERRMLNVNC